MPTPRRRLAVAAAPDGRLYAIGGETGGLGTVSSVVEVYDPSAQAWSSGPPMPQGLAGWTTAVTGFDGRIHVVTDRAYAALDPVTDTWSNVAAIPQPYQRVGAFSLAAVGHTLMVVGASEAAMTNQPVCVSVYDLDTQAWSFGPALQEAITGGGSAAAPDGSVLSVGGFLFAPLLADDSVHVLRPDAAAWVPGTPLPRAMALHGVVTNSLGWTIAVGGRNGVYSQMGTFLTDVYALDSDPVGGAWVTMAPLQDARTSAGVCAGTDGRVYVIGGEAQLGSSTVVVGTVEVFTP